MFTACPQCFPHYCLLGLAAGYTLSRANEVFEEKRVDSP